MLNSVELRCCLAGLFARPITKALCALLVCVCSLAEAQELRSGEYLRATNTSQPEWRRRARQGVMVVRREGDEMLPDGALQPRDIRTLGLRPMRQGLLDQSAWPDEPKSPGEVDVKRFTDALAQLCPAWIGRRYVASYAESIVRHSKRFGVDPMLLAALMYQQSRCQAGLRNSYGTGLAMINPHMHRRSFVGTAYRHGVFTSSMWSPKSLPLPTYPFTDRSLRDAEANLYFAAAFLAVFRDQCPHIDGYFASVPHRHYVSHFVWGDRVRGAGPEDRILLARRRLIEYYRPKIQLRRMGKIDELELTVPLDGSPRVVSSEFGDERDNGARLHKGVDFLSEQGEPVRAVASGVVVEAGPQFRRRGHVNMDPESTRLIPPGRFGPQGLHVRIRHGGSVETLYAHLVAYTVRAGERVQRGQLLGYVGRTGMRESDAHLHFGIFKNGSAVDPETLLRGGAVFKRRETFGGQGLPADEENPFGAAGDAHRTRLRQRARANRIPSRDDAGRVSRQSVPRAGRVRSANHLR